MADPCGDHSTSTVLSVGEWPRKTPRFEAQRQASKSFDGRGLLAQVKATTLIIRARRDRIVPASDAAELQKIPGSSLVDLPGGHLTLVRSRPPTASLPL